MTVPGSDLFLGISGMSCVNCARGIETGLRQTAGIHSVRVFLADESAEISYDPALIDSAGILTRIMELGYEPRLADSAPEEDTRVREIVLTGLLAFPTVFLAMVWNVGIMGLYLQMLFSGVILVTSGRRFFHSGWRAILNRSPNMDVLVALGVGTSWLYSALTVFVPGLAHGGMAHFEGAALLVFFILLGKGLETWARRMAAGELRRLVDLQQREVRLWETGQERVVTLEEVRVGQTLRVLPGERFPTDGSVLEGFSSADESLLTGESLPVEKGPGMPVISGSVNVQTPLLVKVTRDGADSTLQTLVRAVRRAQGDKPPIQRFADQAAEWFVPAILGLSLLTLIGWLMVGTHFSLALMHAVTVLVVACPCALGLATPTAVVVACGVAMRHGLLVRKPSALEALAGVRFLILDKTGTLTQGCPQVQLFHSCSGPMSPASRERMAALAGASRHPLSSAIRAWFTDVQAQSGVLTELSEERGFGISGRDDQGSLWLLGNQQLLTGKGLFPEPLPPEFEEKALTPVFVAGEGRVIGVFGLRDQPRPEAGEVVQALKKLGITLVMASGDRNAPVLSVAKEMGIDEAHAGLIPAEKLDLVKQYQKRGKTGFVGDGLNDAPSLAAADVGIAIGSGADAAKENTDLVIAGHDLRVLPLAVRLSVATLRKIRQNLLWATIYNLAALPLAAGILVPWLGSAYSLTPELAGLAMALSSVSVVANSLLLRWTVPAGESEPPRASGN